jgi:hypothetical protein
MCVETTYSLFYHVYYYSHLSPKVVVQWLVLLVRIRMVLAQISARRPAILTEGFRTFPQSLNDAHKIIFQWFSGTAEHMQVVRGGTCPLHSKYLSFQYHKVPTEIWYVRGFIFLHALLPVVY